MKKFLSFFCSLFLLLPSLQASPNMPPEHMPHDHYSNLTVAGDFFSLALPLAGIASHYESGNASSLLAPALAVGLVSYGTSELKACFRHSPLGTRPNGYHSSFPSAHTSYAFIGARLIHKKFGLSAGVMAYSLATLTAASRIDGRYHHTRDVLAGAALALSIEALLSKLELSTKQTTLNIRPYKMTGIALELTF